MQLSPLYESTRHYRILIIYFLVKSSVHREIHKIAFISTSMHVKCIKLTPNDREKNQRFGSMLFAKKKKNFAKIFKVLLRFLLSEFKLLSQQSNSASSQWKSSDQVLDLFLIIHAGFETHNFIAQNTLNVASPVIYAYKTSPNIDYLFCSKIIGPQRNSQNCIYLYDHTINIYEICIKR